MPAADQDPASPLLHEKAKEAIEAGRLPSTSTERFWGGDGSGLPCAVCGLPIEPGHAEVHLELEVDAEGPRFHGVCHYAWRQVCEELKRLASSRPPTSSLPRGPR